MAEWWAALPPVQTEVACGEGRHAIRWEEGTLVLPAHADAEAELVLAALGGTKATCVELAEMWGRHADDLDVLALGPRWAGDEIPVTWEDVESVRAQRPGRPRRVRTAPMISASAGSASAAASATASAAGRPGAAGSGGAGGGPALDLVWIHQLELLSLLALGPAFQLRLAGTVAATWRDRTAAGARPALAAALTGRLAHAAQAWLGIDPDRVTAHPHDGPGWGSLELVPAGGSTGAGPVLRASLPIGWLATVWACGLAVVGGHLVVDVQAARWPDVRVLALPGPGAAPATLHLRATTGHLRATTGHGGATTGHGPAPADTAPAGPQRSGDGAHWVVRDTGEEAVST
jgi:hypothetical protein